jgi:hypothetical protein
MEEKIKDILEYYKREKINKETAAKLLLNLHSVVKSLPSNDDAINAIKQQLKDKGYRNDI